MKSVVNSAEVEAHRHRAVAELKEAIRDARVQLSVLNHQVGSRVEVKDVDFDCLDLVSIHGPVSPTALAKLAGLHPATMTGILDRLERGGWIVRDRDASDRRAVTIRVLPDRNAEVLGLYSGMNALIDEVCADYDEAQLQIFAEFLGRIRAAGVTAAEELALG
jgi:DNA-binding MarR family transcriptional regulator